MTTSHAFFNAAPDAIDVPEDGTLSKTLHQDDAVKVVLFAFSAGQELSEHTAAVPALIHQVSGRATWTLGSEAREAHPGDWASMPPKLPHSIVAHEPSVMLLILCKGAKSA